MDARLRRLLVFGTKRHEQGEARFIVLEKVRKIMFGPHPLMAIRNRMVKKLNLGTYEQYVQMGVLAKPGYAYCAYHAAVLAQKLGYKRISLIEFGVAGGNGLIELEKHVLRIQDLLSIEIDIYGFDLGEGLPRPIDYRDLPYHWKEGFYRMDVPKLQAKLRKAKLILGDVRDTVGNFIERYNPAPLAAMMFDLDFYSSTREALRIFDADSRYFLPRIFCYFDDVVGTEVELFNDYTGERLAIREFNEAHATKKLTIPYHLLDREVVAGWYHRIWIYHDFAHPRYNDFVSTNDQQRTLG